MFWAHLVLDDLDPSLRLHPMGKRILIDVEEHTLRRLVDLVEQAVPQR